MTALIIICLLLAVTGVWQTKKINDLFKKLDRQEKFIMEVADHVNRDVLLLTSAMKLIDKRVKELENGKEK